MTTSAPSTRRTEASLARPQSAAADEPTLQADTRGARPAPKKRPATGAPGVNGLITAVAVAATLGGWVVLSLTPTETPSALAPASIAPADVAAAPAAAPQLRRVTAPPLVITRSSR